MASKRHLYRLKSLLAAGAVAATALAPEAALAYVGPGVGLTAFVGLAAVVAVLLIAVVGAVLFPLRLLMKKRREARIGFTLDGAAEPPPHGPAA